MDKLFHIVFLFAFAVVIYKIIKARMIARRERLIDAYTFPDSIATKIVEKYPHLSKREANRAMAGLREYFHICNVTGNKMVSMPSQVVDVAWHEFILFTKKYDYFCSKALGRFLHHTPAEAMESATIAQTGIKRAWRASCHREGINPKLAAILPLLFSIDADLNIPDGFKYSLDCEGLGSNDFCAGHIGCSSGCAGDSGGDSSGCSGGCGGD